MQSNRTNENFEGKKKFRKIVSKERRKAITAYWSKKSAELHENPSAFYKTFKPFISAKSKESPDICLRTSDGLVTSNQAEVTELLANLFTTAASNIGGDHVNNLS